MLFAVLYVVMLTALTAHSHIFMQSPASRRNKYSNFYAQSGQVDYNINAPLLAFGYTFPCKGFPKGPATSVVSGGSVQVTLEGTAVHGGGHCQFGISYDENTFLVLKTVQGSCLLDSMSYSVPLPTNIPSGDVVLFWTWINKIGNREYYMECADVRIQNGNTNANVLLVGKELLVVNLPGFPTIPEFPNPGMYDGADLLDKRRTLAVQVGGAPSSPEQQTSNSSPQSSALPLLSPTEPEPCDKDDIVVTQKCVDGEMRCKNGGFDTCDHQEWMWRPCAPGTSCQQASSSIFCG